MKGTLTLGGIYPPLPTFFHEDESLDLETLAEHIRRLRERGITRFVALGSNGEAVHLDPEERHLVIAAVRAAAGDEAQLLAGAGANSTRETIALCRLAAAAGADVALVIPPHHYRNRMDSTALRGHYLAVADASPLPVMLYNMPGNAAGIDLDAETVIALSAHPNIIGLKPRLPPARARASSCWRAARAFCCRRWWWGQWGPSRRWPISRRWSVCDSWS